jgi:hypothetical protein
MSSSSESCYECGGEIPVGLGQLQLACLWKLSGAGEHWGWVEICPACGQRRHRRRMLVLALAALFVAGLTALVAYPFLP